MIPNPKTAMFIDRSFAADGKEDNGEQDGRMEGWKDGRMEGWKVERSATP